jgi:hypothetical protein
MHLQLAGSAVHGDQVALLQAGQDAATACLRGDMDGRRELARGARQPAVGDQCDLAALVLHHPQQRRQRMQLGHAIGLRALEAHHRDKVMRQGAGGMQPVQCGRCVDHHGWCRDAAMLRLHRRQLDQPLAQVAFEQAQAALGLERVGDRAQHTGVGAGGGACDPVQALAVQARLLAVIADATRGDGANVAMHQAGLEQFGKHQRGTARGGKVVHVGLAVGVDMAQGRHHR